MTHAEKRQQYQLDFTKSGKEIEVGDTKNLPLPLEVIKNIDEKSQYVEKHIKGGLTSEVFKLKINNNFYTLKKKRKNCLVQNVDGQTSFLNEIQRRADFNNAKESNKEGLESVIDTIYASFKHEIIFSPWVEGHEVEGYNEEILDNLFFTLFNMEKAGVFEYDLCNGNILIRKDNKIQFFDFGYAYPFDPLSEYNGDSKEIPDFHMAERFETRTFMQHLTDIEETLGLDKALELYKIEKKVALKYYSQKAQWLKENNADEDIIANTNFYIKLWHEELKTYEGLKKLYSLERFRSFLLDFDDDVKGRSCNPDTLIKGEKVIKSLKEDYDFLKENNIFLPEDTKLSQTELIEKYTDYLETAANHQLDDLSGFNEWKERRMESIKKFYI